jgi:predicted GIY-YIG superfamily endonuclease
MDQDRPYRDYKIPQLRELVADLREELKSRKSPSARRLREEIDPQYEIGRPHDCCVYVIELDPAVRDDRSFARKNPDARPDRPCLYVGSTFKSPEERFAQHKAGDQHSRIVRKYGVHLRPEFYRQYPPLTRTQAEDQEKALARLLRGEGYGVWQE